MVPVVVIAEDGVLEVGLFVCVEGNISGDLQYSVLCYDDNWYQRGIKETIAINTLNQDEGHHHLSPIYSKLIRSSFVLKTSDKKETDGSEVSDFG